MEKFDDAYSHALDMVLHGMSTDRISPPLFSEKHIKKIKRKVKSSFHNTINRQIAHTRRE